MAAIVPWVRQGVFSCATFRVVHEGICARRVSCSLIDFLIGFLLSQPSTPRACTPSASQTHLDTLKRHASRKASAARAQTLHLRRSLVFLSSYLGFFSAIADAVLGSLMVLRSCSGIGICISLPFVGEGKLSRTLRKITLVHSSAVRWTELFVCGGNKISRFLSIA